jgi:hypothetical protein
MNYSVELEKLLDLLFKCRCFRIKFPEVNLKNDPDFYLNYSKEIGSAKPHDCVPVDSNFPLYMLYTSGNYSGFSV